MNIKKVILIIAASLACVAIIPSCHKEPEAARKTKTTKQPRGKEAIAGKKENASQAAKAAAIFSDKNTSLAAVREGQYVNLNWHIDMPGANIQQIDILRNSTGVGRQRIVGILDPKAINYKDCLPDANAYWYWLRILTADNGSQTFGPVKVASDKAGDISYINLEDKYNASVTRTFELATIKWDFPEDEYKAINIARYTRPFGEPPFEGRSRATKILTTLAWKSQSANAFPDPNSEYWYWFQIILKSGAIIYKGPIKAEYGNQ